MTGPMALGSTWLIVIVPRPRPSVCAEQHVVRVLCCSIDERSRRAKIGTCAAPMAIITAYGD